MPSPVAVAAEGVGIRPRRHGRLAAAVGPGAERAGVEDAQPDADLQPRRLGPDARDDLAEEPRPVLERPP